MNFASLQGEIAQCQQAEDQICQLNEELEQRVVERTAQLEAANLELKHEVSEHRRTSEALQNSERELAIRNQILNVFLNFPGEEMYVEALKVVLKIMDIEIGGYRLAWVGFAQADEGKTVRPVAQTGLAAGHLETLRLSWADNEWGRGPIGTAIRTGQPCACRNTKTDPAFAPWREEVIRHGIGSVLGLPLCQGNQTIGALGIYAAEPEAFDNQEVKLLRELADDLAFGMVALRTRAERQQAEEALRERTKILDAFFDNPLTPMVFLDRNFNFIRVYEAYARACQRTATDFPGHNHFEFFPSAARELFEQVVRTKQPYQAIERPFTFPDHPEWGTTYWDWILVPILDSAGAVQFLVLSLNNLTERKRAEEALRESEAKYRIVAENTYGHAMAAQETPRPGQPADPGRPGNQRPAWSGDRQAGANLWLRR